MRLAPLPFLLLLAAGCPNGGTDGSGDTNGGNDSGDTGTIDLGPPGCINLNGETGDFATINAALEYAQAGDTVNVCAGAYSEHVVLDLGVHIVGAGSASTSIDAPVNESAFELTGPGAGVSGFTITSTRSGVTIEGASDVALTDLVFDNVANYGVEATEPTGLTISACAFTMPAYGGVFVSGGTATVDGSLFTEPTSYGIWATGGAVLTATNNIFDQVHATTSDGSDGHAIFGDKSTVVMSNNVITTDDLIGVWVEKGSLSMSGDLFADNPYAVFSIDSAFSADAVEVYGSVNQGIYVTSSEPVSLTNTTVSLNGGNTTGLTSCSEDYDVWTGLCGGVRVDASATTISGVSVSGYENFGMFLQPLKAAQTLELALSSVTLDNNGRWSLYVTSATATVDGLIVTNHREPDTVNTEPCYGYVDRADAAVFEQSDVTVTNSTITDGGGWGFAFVLGTAELTNSTTARNKCSGVMNYSGSLIATGNSFSEAMDYGGLFNYEGAFVLDNNTFTDTKYNQVDEYDDGSGTGAYYRYEYTGNGRDVLAVRSSACAITDNTFSHGDNSLSIEETGCDISGNSWTDYNGQILYAYQGSESDPISFHDNVVEDVGGPVVANYYGYAEVEDVTVGTMRNYTSSYASYFVSADGVETLNYSYESSYAQPAFVASGYYGGYWSDTDSDGVNDLFTEYGYSSSLKIDNVSVGTSLSNLVSGSEAALDIHDLTAETVGGYGIYDSWNHYPPQVEIEGVDFGSTTYAGLYLEANTEDAGYALLSDINVGVAGGAGIQIGGIAEVSVDGATVLDATGSGLAVDGYYSTYDYETSTYLSGNLAYLGTFSNIEVTSATLDGISLTDGVVSLTASSASGGDASGAALVNTDAVVTGNSFKTNALYGMTCSNVTLTTCSGNVLEENVTAPHLDCSDDCSL